LSHFCGIVSEDRRFMASTGDGEVTEARVEQLGMNTGIGVNQNPFGSEALGAVAAVAVEDWLKTLPLANGSEAKIREVFGAAFRHAIRHELYPTNPIASVRQPRKRAEEPEILEPEEITLVLRELTGIEPIRTAFLIAAIMGMRRGEILVSSGQT
jgi:integrase